MAEPRMTTDASAVPLPFRREPTCPFDPSTEYKRLRGEDPVISVPTPSGEQVWLITRYADVRQVFSDNRRFVSRQPPVVLERPPSGAGAGQFSPGQVKGFFVNADGPEHARYRQMLAPLFTVRHIGSMRSRIEQIVARQLDDLEQAGPATDLVEAFTQPIPGLVICELLGFPPGDRTHFHRLLARMEDLTLPHDQVRTAITELIVYVFDFVRKQRKAPGQGVIGELISRYSHELSDEELAGISGMFLLAGYWPPANVLATGILLLLRHPDQLAMLRDDPELSTNAVEEVLRYLSIVNIGQPRTATEDVLVGGKLIKAGEYVMCSLASANRDENFHDDGDRFDVTRKPSAHVAFGHGPHQCLGQQLARMVFRTAIPALARRYPHMQLAVPFGEIEFFAATPVHGIHSLPVTLGPSTETATSHNLHPDIR